MSEKLSKRNLWRTLVTTSGIISSQTFCEVNDCPDHFRTTNVSTCNYDDAVYKWTAKSNDLRACYLSLMDPQYFDIRRNCSRCKQCEYCNSSFRDIEIAIKLWDWNMLGASLFKKKCSLCMETPIFCHLLRLPSPQRPNNILGRISNELISQVLSSNNNTDMFDLDRYFRSCCAVDVLRIMDNFWVPIHIQLAFLKKLAYQPIQDFITYKCGSRVKYYSNPLMLSFQMACTVFTMRNIKKRLLDEVTEELENCMSDHFTDLVRNMDPHLDLWQHHLRRQRYGKTLHKTYRAMLKTVFKERWQKKKNAIASRCKSICKKYMRKPMNCWQRNVALSENLLESDDYIRSMVSNYTASSSEDSSDSSSVVNSSDSSSVVTSMDFTLDGPTDDNQDNNATSSRPSSADDGYIDYDSIQNRPPILERYFHFVTQSPHNTYEMDGDQNHPF